MSARKKCPREGSRLKFAANPASVMLYGGRTPAQGEVGTVTSVPLPGAGRKTCTGGHPQDLVYVQWPSVGVMGVARADVTKTSAGAGEHVSLGDEGSHKLSIGQRVITPHGEGSVRSAQKNHVGVLLDDGSFVSVEPHEIQRSAQRQTYFQGLGSSPEEHSRAAYAAAQEGYKRADQAATKLQKGQCSLALDSMAAAYVSYGRLTGHLDSGGDKARAFRTDTGAVSHVNAETASELWHRLFAVSEGIHQKCLRGGK